MENSVLTKREFEGLSEFHCRLRRFLHFSEQVVRKHGTTPLQYLLLHIKGFPERDWARVGKLAERLQARHHGGVAPTSRCKKLGWLVRRQNQADRREVEVHLAAKSERMVTGIAQLHRDEHSNVGGSSLLPQLRSPTSGHTWWRSCACGIPGFTGSGETPGLTPGLLASTHYFACTVECLSPGSARQDRSRHPAGTKFSYKRNRPVARITDTAYRIEWLDPVAGPDHGRK